MTIKPERTDQFWKYPYMAAAIDFGSSISPQIGQSDTSAIGYQFSIRFSISTNDKTVIGFIDEFCENHDIETKLRSNKSSYQVVITQPKDIRKLLQLTEQFIIARSEAARILLKHLLPGLEMDKDKDKAGFIKLMGYVDEIRELTRSGGQVKYTQDYFRDEFGM